MLGRDLRAVRGPLVRVLLWSLVQGLPVLVSGRVLELAVNRGFLVHRPLVGLLFLLLLAAGLLLGAVATRAMFPWLADTVEPLRDVLVTRLVRAALRRAVRQSQVPDTAAVARLTGQVETVRGLVGAILRSARSSAVGLVAALVGLLSLAPAVAAFVLVPLAASGVVFTLSLRTLARRRRAVVLLDEAIAAESGAVLGAVRDIVVCNAQGRACAGLDELIARQAAATTRLAWAGALRTVTVSLGGELPLIGLLLAGSRLAGGGRLDAGQLLGAISYVTAGMLPALRSLAAAATTWGIQLGTVLGRIQQAVIDSDADDEADADPDADADVPGLSRQQSTSSPRASPRPRLPGVEEAAAVAAAGGGPSGAPGGGPGCDGTVREPSGYAISVRGLRFRYGAAADPVFADLTLSIPEGDHLAVVGPSGIGKSTLTQLLVGALRAERGEVRLGGVAVGELPPRRARRIRALVPQEAYVFAGTLRENLTYLAPGADDGRIAAAASATGLAAVIDRLGGLDAEVGAGAATLSGGEAQLLAATRVFLSDAAVVILDEATCHLDPPAEARVETALAARPGTLIVVAHRLSSAQRASRVLLLDGAEPLVASPAELSALSPLYAESLGYWQPGAVDPVLARTPT
ncbi:ABC transporter ATP-binding protein, partial [Actinocrinis puniceicyclus]